MQETLRDLSSILELRRSPGGGCGNPLPYSCLENPMDRGDWQAKVHRVRVWHNWSYLTCTHACYLCAHFLKRFFSLIINGCRILSKTFLHLLRGSYVFLFFNSLMYSKLVEKLLHSGWDGSLRENRYIYMYGWISLLLTCNYHNIFNWLYPYTNF